jgi:hypothetical protein
VFCISRIEVGFTDFELGESSGALEEPEVTRESKDFMSLRRDLYRLGRSCEVGVALNKREEARTPKRLAAKVDRLVSERAERNRGMCSEAVDFR